MSLTPEQQRALEGLLACLPPTSLRKVAEPDSREQASVDLFKTWLGIDAAEAKARLMGLLAQKDRLEQRFRAWTDENPLDATFEFLGVASYAFYLAEKDENPKIKTYIDAFYYISTCASVGYADIFAATQTGRAIAALVMVLGPAMTNKVIDHPQK